MAVRAVAAVSKDMHQRAGADDPDHSDLFLAISFVLCVLSYLVLPGLPVKYEALANFLPGFELLTWQGFAIGLAESYAWAGMSPCSWARSTTSLPRGRCPKG